MARIIESLKSAIRYAKGNQSVGHPTLILQLKGISKERLKRLVKAAEMADEAEVVSNALRMYEACVKEVNLGNKVIVRRTDGTEIEVMGAE